MWPRQAQEKKIKGTTSKQPRKTTNLEKKLKCTNSNTCMVDLKMG